MATINGNYNNLAAGYLCPEIAKRAKAFLEKNPGIQIMRLGIGDTTHPLPKELIARMKEGVEKLAHKETYTGYADNSFGMARLRKAIADRYRGWGCPIHDTDIFVSDGAKPDSANIQSIFGLNNVVAVQDPAYPVYVDSNVIAGRGGTWDGIRYAGLVYMPCTEENGFFPALPDKKVDLIYICSPNNPTGAVATKEQLKAFVDYAIANKADIIFDAAYAAYISDPSLPKSIFQIKGATSCALEINSFSKEAGFTGVRLGWTVVPQELAAEDAVPGKIQTLWMRRQNTMFNGASNIAQEGGIAALSPEGSKGCKAVIDYYMNNARIIKQGLEKIGIKVFGGINAPYIWLQTPGKMDSWQFFDKLLTETHVVGTPGVGFGPNGQGYFRLSAFGHTENVQKAVESVQKNLKI